MRANSEGRVAAIYTVHLMVEVYKYPSIACQEGQCKSPRMFAVLWSKPHGGGGVMTALQEPRAFGGGAHLESSESQTLLRMIDNGSHRWL